MRIEGLGHSPQRVVCPSLILCLDVTKRFSDDPKARLQCFHENTELFVADMCNKKPISLLSSFSELPRTPKFKNFLEAELSL